MAAAPGALMPTNADDHTCRPRIGGPLVNGVRIDPLTPGEFLETVESFLACGRCHVVHFCAAHPTTEARRDAAYRDLLNRGDLNLADGMPVAWAARLAGHPAQRLAGTDGLGLVARWGLERELRHYLYGSAPPTLEAMQRRLEATFGGIRIVGTESPPYRPLSDDEVAESAARMRAAGADVVWVGLGAPKQDVMGERLRALEAAPAILCVGAAFDFVAGVKRRAPAWMRRTGLEWAHRLASEPTRLWRRYLVGNPRFVLGVLSDRLRGGGDPWEQRSG
jgi:N-acetylglucosaminyldiphosphoundecaprenol N-acetyl-beta-D-mannosaminyltransferase